MESIVNSISRMNQKQLAARVLRRARYRCIYPFAGLQLFPVDAAYDFSLKMSSRVQSSRAVADKRSVALLQEAEALCAHRFVFLNLPPADLGSSVDWRFMPDNDRLWQYNLHYGEWAQSLSQAFTVTGDIRYRDALIGLVADWIDHNNVCEGPGWEPYPLSRRLVAWSRIGLSLANDDVWKGFWKERLAPSLHQQTRVLAANLEHDLSNNHLLANYRALAWIGMLFPSWPGADRWRTRGLDGLWSEKRRQVLGDGVHNERSISYHTIVLQDLLETWHLCKERRIDFPTDLEPVLQRMFQFLADMVAPDGSYPMLNDTVPGYPQDPRSVLLAGGLLFGRFDWVSLCAGVDRSYADLFAGMPQTIAGEAMSDSRQSHAVFPDAGYAVVRDEKGNCLYFDAGAMGPDHLPGHGHADALSFVLYGGGMPLIVDPGVYSYHDRTWRDHFRSTAAHNTVTIDSQDQCVFWGNFRVAYPPKASLTEWSGRHVVGEHEGYTRLGKPVLHRRSIRLNAPGEYEIADRFEGQGEHDFSLTLQFAPGGEVKDTGRGATVGFGEAAVEIAPVQFPSGHKVFVEDGWVSPGWNLKEKGAHLVLHWRSEVPVETKLILKVR